jgi:hypothetical protein
MEHLEQTRGWRALIFLAKLAAIRNEGIRLEKSRARGQLVSNSQKGGGRSGDKGRGYQGQQKQQTTTQSLSAQPETIDSNQEGQNQQKSSHDKL